MSIIITSLRVDYRASEYQLYDNVKYAIVNVTFKIQEDEDLHGMAVNDSKQWRSTLSVDDPEKYDEWFIDSWLPLDDDDESTCNTPIYPGHRQTWISNEPTWNYIEKFDTFHFREWIADTPVTRSILHEIEHYKTFGKLPSVYRATDEWILLHHIRTLHSYWD